MNLISQFESLRRQLNDAQEEADRHRIYPGTDLINFNNDPATVSHIKSYIQDMKIQRKFWLYVALMHRFQKRYATIPDTSSHAEQQTFARKIANDYSHSWRAYQKRLQELGH